MIFPLCFNYVDTRFVYNDLCMLNNLCPWNETNLILRSFKCVAEFSLKVFSENFVSVFSGKNDLFVVLLYLYSLVVSSA